MPTVTTIRCQHCGVHLVVFPPVLIAFVPPEARSQMRDQLGELQDDQGRRFAIASEGGHFRCPACDSEAYAPQIELQ
jgi:DNA-directed RNA polymerase subunit RPC12/RpoP